MSEQHDDQHDDIRHLLADARHDEPIPADVAARLDDVLAQLAADPAEPEQRAEPERVATAIDLESRRRRNRVRGLFLAAAAVVAVGVGVSQLDVGGRSDSDMLSTAESADDSAGDSNGGSAAGSADEPAAAPGRESNGLERAARDLDPSMLRVDDDDFADVALNRMVTLSAALAGITVQEFLEDPESYDLDTEDFADSSGENASPTAPGTVPDEQSESRSSWDADACGAGPYGQGRLLLVRYRRHPAVLAVRPAVGDSTVVDLLRCGTGEVLRSATVPTP